MIEQTDFESVYLFLLNSQLQTDKRNLHSVFSGVDQHLIEKILDPSYLDGIASTFSNLRDILKSSATSAAAWVGEAGGAYNSGRHLVSNSFVFSFW